MNNVYQVNTGSVIQYVQNAHLYKQVYLIRIVFSFAAEETWWNNERVNRLLNTPIKNR